MNYQKLFNYMSNVHGIILLESEMQEIIEICDDIKTADADKSIIVCNHCGSFIFKVSGECANCGESNCV